jgi:hypothetical protein
MADDDAGGMDREEMIKRLTEAGFKLYELEDAGDELLATILRRMSGDEDDDEFDEAENIGHPQSATRAGPGRLPDDDDDFAEDDEEELERAAQELPDPVDDEEGRVFAERAAFHLRRAKRAAKKYAGYSDDRNSVPPPSGGTIGRGTSRETRPAWDATQAFCQNRNGVQQFGISSPDELRRHLNGDTKEPGLPKRAKEGTQAFSERPPASSYGELLQRNREGLRQLGITTAAQLQRRMEESRRG